MKSTLLTSNDLCRRLAEIEGETRLIGSEVVDMEDELFREILLGSPHGPADTGVREAVLVARRVDGDDTS